MPCIKAVVNVICQFCYSETIKFGKTGIRQRYRCKQCGKIQLAIYRKYAYEVTINAEGAIWYRGVHSLLPASGDVRSSMPVDGAREAAALAFTPHSRLNGGEAHLGTTKLISPPPTATAQRSKTMIFINWLLHIF